MANKDRALRAGLLPLFPARCLHRARKFTQLFWGLRVPIYVGAAGSRGVPYPARRCFRPLEWVAGSGDAPEYSISFIQEDSCAGLSSWCFCTPYFALH